jgi:glycosyltransferase involved in cell wall biosynthesis
MQIRRDAVSNFGGDTLQMLKTAEYLGKLGVDVHISSSSLERYSSYDLVHLFNVTNIEDTYVQAQNTINHHKKFVISPIYWSERELIARSVVQVLFTDLSLFYCKSLLSKVSIRTPGLALHTEPVARQGFKRKKQTFVLRAASAVLPNSRAEASMLSKDFGIKCDLIRIVPNGVDVSLFSNHHSSIDFGLSEFVLMVARFDLRKNQLGLIRATKDVDIPMVFIGKPSSSILAQEYYKKCMREAGKNVRFLQSIKHENLPAIYRACKVHALPSFFETPGLASLEAALAGANIVSTNRGATYEYFGNLAWYCEPGNYESIKNAVVAAWQSPKSDRLAKLIQMRNSWEAVARETKRVYELVLD